MQYFTLPWREGKCQGYSDISRNRGRLNIWAVSWVVLIATPCDPEWHFGGMAETQLKFTRTQHHRGCVCTTYPTKLFSQRIPVLSWTLTWCRDREPGLLYLRSNSSKPSLARAKAYRGQWKVFPYPSMEGSGASETSAVTVMSHCSPQRPFLDTQKSVYISIGLLHHPSAQRIRDTL